MSRVSSNCHFRSNFESWAIVGVFMATLLWQQPAIANPFAGGWEMDPNISSLSFQSLKEKNGIKSEISEFKSLTASVNEQGLATLVVDLDSVDTKVDLRNVRMRFLFFQTFKFPIATVTAQVDETTMLELIQSRRINTQVDFELDLHGIKKALTANVRLTLFTDDQLSIATVEPISIATEIFGLEEGRAKLEDAAKVKIIPYGSVSFDLVFKRGSADGAIVSSNDAENLTPKPAPVVEPVPTVASSSVSTNSAVETSGNFSKEQCAGRFEILSQTGAVYFRTGSSALDPQSFALLDTVVSIVNRCPSLNVVVEGHTDSVGSEQINLNLSVARAESVVQFLTSQGIDPYRLRSVGFGETRPVAPNDTSRNKRRNRRIEFKAIGS